MQNITNPPQANASVPINNNFLAVAPSQLFGRRAPATTGLTWAYWGQGLRFNGNTIADGTVSLTASNTNYIVANRSTGAVTAATNTTNWNNETDYLRLYSVVAGSSSITSYVDYRQSFGAPYVGAQQPQCIPVACSDETTALTIGTGKVTFRMPYAFTLTAVRASVTTAPTGADLVVDINESGSSILSTKLSIDATEKTSTTAATPPVISDASLANDAEITIDIDQVGSTLAGAGLKVYLIGVPA